MNMFELTGNFLTVHKMIENDEIDSQSLIDTLESIECAIEVKVENTVYVIENAKANKEGLVMMIKALQAKLGNIENNIERLQSSLFSNLELMGVSSYKAGVFTVKQQKNPVSVEIIDKGKIPAKYQTVVPESYVPRKADIAKDLKLGIEVPGCELKNSTRWVIK